MEFHEKLQILRKNRGLTQEELAEALYVSRTAVSKWESGRGYPNIDSLKDISSFFSISIDELLSGEALLAIAEKENKENIRNMCELLFGIADICVFLLIVLPLYPNPVGEHVYSVNLFAYNETILLHRMVYWLMFIALIAIGSLKMILATLCIKKGNRVVTTISLGISAFMVLFLAVSREAYAVTMAFMLLLIKTVLLFRWKKI